VSAGYTFARISEVIDSESIVSISTERKVAFNSRSTGTLSLNPSRMNSNSYLYELEFFVNNQPVPLIRLADGMWTFQTARLSESKNQLEATAFIVPRKNGNSIKNAIKRIDQEIQNMRRQMREEFDPEKKSLILAEIEKRINTRDNLVQQYGRLRIKIGRTKYEAVETIPVTANSR